MKTRLTRLPLILCFAICYASLLLSGIAQGTAFTYQGRLYDGTSLANGNYDMRFHVYNAATGGSILGGPITNAPVTVSNGLFTVLLDFGPNVFTGSSDWLQIGVRTNGSSASYLALLPRQQLTPTPYSIYSETANAAGLSGTVPAGSLSGVNGTGLTGLALLNGGNTYTGNETIDGMLDISDGAGIGSFTDLNIGPGGYYSGEEHSINFNDSTAGKHVGSLILGYNGNGYFSFGNLYYGNYQSGTKVFTVDGDGDVNVDPDDLNSGFLNSGNTNSSGLTFGAGSGEGIGSQRTAGTQRYSLDFYTAFVERMNISQGGLVGIGTGTNVATAALEVANGAIRTDGSALLCTPAGGAYGSDGLYDGSFGLSGINFDGTGPGLWGYYGGSLGALNPNVMALSWDSAGDVQVNKQLTVAGEFMVVNGLTPVYAYMGDDGSGNDVQIGSQKSGITALAAYNTADGAYMHFYCSSITIEGGSDLAEPFKLTQGNEEISEGAVVVIDDQNPGRLKLSDQTYDTRVAGVVSGANGIHPGIQMQQHGLLEGGKNVALTGRVYVQADTENGAIKPGDLLTTSSIPGRAMKVTDHARAAGAILGKAMTSLSEGKGMVLVLVTLQ
jgi:hypothetical protein